MQAVIQHNAKVPKISPLNYVRDRDRAKVQGNAPATEADVDDIPF